MADSSRAERRSDRSLGSGHTLPLADAAPAWHPPGLSHLVLRRLVPMCGLQDGDELPVLGVGPAADAWWREAR